MARARTYGDRCGVARALDAVGERWALLVVRELLLGPKRFTDLRAGLPHVGPDVLAQRLRELERDGLLERRTLAPPAASRVYELTPRGRELEPVVLALGRWGSVAPFPPAPDATIGPDALAIALKTLFDPVAAAGLDLRAELRLGDHAFRVRVAGGALELVRGEDPGAELAIAGEPAALAAVLWHGRPLAEARQAGELRTTGRAADLRRLLQAFPLPAAAAAAAAATPR